MTRQEFIDALTLKLYEELSTAEVLSQVQYYQGYIDGETARGRSEEEVIDELGDPVLIARTILESPSPAGSFFGRREPDPAESYEEGAYEGRHAKTGEEVREQIRQARERTEEQYREAAAASGAAAYGYQASDAEAGREASYGQQASDNKADRGASYGYQTSDTEAGRQASYGQQASGAEAGRQTSGQAADSRTGYQEPEGRTASDGPDGRTGRRSKDSRAPYREPDGRTEFRYRGGHTESTLKESSGEEPSTPFWQDSSGSFNWALLAVILAGVLILVAVIWLFTKIVSLLGPVVLLVCAALLIFYTIRGNHQS